MAAEDKITLYATLKKELFDSHDNFMSWTTDNEVVDVEVDFNTVLLLIVKKLGYNPMILYARQESVILRWFFGVICKVSAFGKYNPV